MGRISRMNLIFCIEGVFSKVEKVKSVGVIKYKCLVEFLMITFFQKDHDDGNYHRFGTYS